MKKFFKITFLTGVFMLLLCAAAYADGAAGIYDLQITPPDGMTVEVTPLTAEGAVAAAGSATIDGAPATTYENAEKLSVEITGANAKYYLILAQNENAPPTDDNIRYVDQCTSVSGSASFTVYPDRLRRGESYYIFITGSDGSSSMIASFKYYVSFMSGDVDGSGDVGLNDAVLVLRHLAELDTLEGDALAAADADKNGSVSLSDAVCILRTVAGLSAL